MMEENNSTTTETSKSEAHEAKNNLKAEEKEEEIKQLEEKEHHELEYFSKEECVEDNKNLRKELAEIKEKAEELQKESNTAKKKYMHLQAEFENAQKRWNKTRQDLHTQYTASVLKNFLPLYDSFKKALENANDTEKDILNGFYTQFMNVFKSYGAEPIEVKINDSFDYSLHEALTSVEKEDLAENTIVEIVQDGFRYGKEVIRYTKVIVSKKPKPPEPKPKEEKIIEEDVKELKVKETDPKEESKEKKNKEKKPKKQKKEKNDKESD